MPPDNDPELFHSMGYLLAVLLVSNVFLILGVSFLIARSFFPVH